MQNAASGTKSLILAFVLLGEKDSRSFVAVWAPGQTLLSLKTIRLPSRAGGSDSFAPIR